MAGAHPSSRPSHLDQDENIRHKTQDYQKQTLCYWLLLIGHDLDPWPALRIKIHYFGPLWSRGHGPTEYRDREQPGEAYEAMFAYLINFESGHLVYSSRISNLQNDLLVSYSNCETEVSFFHSTNFWETWETYFCLYVRLEFPEQ